MKKIFVMLALSMACLAASAEEQEVQGVQEAPEVQDIQETQATQEKTTVELPAWVRNIKFSGYGMLQYQYQDKESGKTNSFNLRLLRMILDGKVGDFDWRVQIQGTNAKGAGEPTVQLVDLYTEWVKHKEFKVRVGQFKRAFTFENPTHPVTQGWRGYADVINRLSGFGDRVGEKSSGGRDIGIQLAGDVLPDANGRAWLHYQIGVYNGEGINRADQDNRKDIIGGLWVMPVKGLRVGAFGWTGSHGNMETADGTGQSVPLNRYCLSAEWDKDEYTFRAEYLHSQGWGSGVIGSNVVNYDLGDKADGWYVFGIVPLIKSKLHAKARYQSYRVSKEWGSSVNQVECGLNYFFTKNLELHLEYSHVNDRTQAKHDYNLMHAELDFRF